MMPWKASEWAVEQLTFFGMRPVASWTIDRLKAVYRQARSGVAAAIISRRAVLPVPARALIASEDPSRYRSIASACWGVGTRADLQSGAGSGVCSVRTQVSPEGHSAWTARRAVRS